TSLLISDVTEGGPDQETGHQPCGLDSSVEVERVTTLLRSKSLQVDVPKDASSPLGKRDLSTRVGGANLVHLSDIGQDLVPDPRLTVGKHPVGDILQDYMSRAPFLLK